MSNLPKCLLIFALLSAPNVLAQFTSLSTTDDGSVVYFSTPMVRTGTDQPSHGKVFRIGTNGLEVVEIREMVPTPDHPLITNFYDILRVTVSGDGAILATAGRRDCGEMGCEHISNTSTTAGGGGVAGSMEGPSTMSTNGRYLVNYSTPNPGRFSPLVQMDLTSGESWTLLGTEPSAPHIVSSRRIVSDNGLVVGLIFGGDLGVWERGEPRRLTFGSESIESAMIDALGRAVVFVSRWPVPYDGYSRLRHVDLVTGALVTVNEELPEYSLPSVSNDGMVISFQSGGQLYVVQSDGTGLRKLTEEPDGIASSVLSGDGRVAYGVTAAGRLIRVDVESGEVSEVLGRTQNLSGIVNIIVPGSALMMTGSGLDEADLMVTVGGLNAPIIRAAPGELTVQVPWALPVGNSVTIRISSSEQSEFAGSLERAAKPWSWFPYVLGKPLHEEGGRPVTSDDPASANETIHLMVTGLGAVSAPVETGVPQPAEPAAVLARSLTCYHGDGGVGPEMEMLYAGLEPGLLGVYRVSLRMPPVADAGPAGGIYVSCRTDNSSDPSLNLTVPFVE